MGCLSQLSSPPHLLLPPCWRHFSFSSSRFPQSSISRKNGRIQCGESKTSLSQEYPADKTPNDAQEPEYRVVTAIKSGYNEIVILDTAESRILLLDSTYNVHSMFNKEGKWTGAYWDEFAAFPPIVPDGPIAIFGLGGGTSAHLMLDLWPSLQLQGWEIDHILIDQAREYLGLSSLEQQSSAGGVLNIHIGDVFSPDTASISGGYAGIIVDLFMNGKVLPQLEQADTWLELHSRLMPNGRLMVNCGAGDEEFCDTNDSWKLNASIRALCKAFPGQVCWKKMPKGAGENYIAVTGRLPDLDSWAAALPHQLAQGICQWKPCS